MFQHLVAANHWVLFWPDLPHKFQRKQAMAMAECPDAKAKLKQFMRVFRSSRAPFSTSKFGKSLKEAKLRMIRAFKQDPDHDILAMYLPGFAKDVGAPVHEMDSKRAIDMLSSSARSSHVMSTVCKDVRWGAWLDHAQAWDRVWHQELLVQMYQMWEAGENPFQGSVGEVPEDERVFSIKKIRWQVTWSWENKSSVLIKSNK